MSPSRREDHLLLSAARAYAERGWRVFPLHPKDKKPITSDGFKSATTDRNMIEAWWATLPDANIGLATGDPFDVLDLDSPDAVPAVREVLGADYRHNGPVVSTGKGWHFYFAATGSGNRAGLLGGKVDYRGSGGYVVAPPSVHPSGRLYEWDGDRDAKQPLPVVPESLLGVVSKPSPRDRVPVAVRTENLSGQTIVRLTTSGKTKVQRPDILMVAESFGLDVVRKGNKWVTNCVFHHDPGPSMVLYTDDNTFHCFGCEAHGDSHDLSRKQDMTGRVANI